MNGAVAKGTVGDDVVSSASRSVGGEGGAGALPADAGEEFVCTILGAAEAPRDLCEIAICMR